MRTTSVLSGAALCLIVNACADSIPVEPTAGLRSYHRSAAATFDGAEYTSVSAVMDSMNAQLALAGANVRVMRADVIYKSDGFSVSVGTTIFANDRYRGIGAAWVKGDPRRGGREGVTYAIGSSTGGSALVRNMPTGFRFATSAELLARFTEAMDAWRGIGCSSAPITQVAVPAGTDPDLLDQFFRGQPTSANYAQPADIVQGLWHPRSFFRAIAGGAAGDGILGVTFPFAFVDPATGALTDIDGNGKADLSLAELYYNQLYLWGTSGALDEVDFYSIITHETGHALGLAHFGKVFVTKKDALDDNGAIYLDEVKYAPLAMMNALYLTGRSELTGSDNSTFCQLWASRVR
jgi:hypothetical protein